MIEPAFACSEGCSSMELGPDLGPSTKPCDCWNAEIAKLRARVVELGENSHWEASARDFAKSADYYRGLVVECGKAIGTEAFTADDGGVHEEVLCAKVPELVVAMAARIRELEAALPSREQIYDLPTIVGAEVKAERWDLAVAMADRIEKVRKR